jgi:diacylglycerol kinase family enzyme
VNASIGITAEANRFYNERSGLMERVKRGTGGGVAMTWAALHGLFRAGVKELTVENGGGSGSARRFRVRNLGIVKNPHFAGRLRYDSPHDPTSGDFFVHILGDVGLRRVVTALAGLARGRFVGRSGTRSWRASRLTVSGSVPFAVEMDGEVITTRSAEFSILPQRIRVCA